MIDLHLVEHHALAAHHVVVVVSREVHVHAVRWLRTLSVPDVVRQDDEVLLNIENSARHKQHIREDRIQQRVRIAARPVQQQDSIVHMPASIAMRRAQREVVQLELRQSLACAKPEIRQTDVAILRGQWLAGADATGPVLAEGVCAGKKQGREGGAGRKWMHESLRGYGLSVAAGGNTCKQSGAAVFSPVPPAR